MISGSLQKKRISREGEIKARSKSGTDRRVAEKGF